MKKIALKNLKSRKKKEDAANMSNILNNTSHYNKENRNNTNHNNSLNNSSRAASSVNKKITDYFQIRKSSRKCKSDLEKERREHIENTIKTMIEEGMEIKNIENKGRGVFSTRCFQRGEFVCEYAGEIISYKVAKKREELYAADPSIGCYMYFFEYKSKQYCIDATAETNRLGRLFNHSKTGGNCHTKLFEMNAKPYLILIASRDIKCGEELTYDYGERNRVAIESHPWLAQ